MKPTFLILAIGFGVLTGAGCKKRSDESQVKADIAITTNPESATNFITLMEGLYSSGARTIAADQVFAFFPMTEVEKAVLMQNRNAVATVQCYYTGEEGQPNQRRFCQIRSLGNEALYITLSRMKDTGLWLSTDVKIKVNLISPTEIELCRVEGVSVKYYSYGVFDGARIVANEGKGSFIDIDPRGMIIGTGTFPKRDCPFYSDRW